MGAGDVVPGFDKKPQAAERTWSRRQRRAAQVLSLGTCPWFLRGLLGDSVHARALAQGGLQVGGPPVLLQQVSKCLVGKLLEVLHPVARQQIERVPRLVVKLDPLAWHEASLGQPVEPTAVAAGGSACRPRIFGIGAEPGHHEHRKPSTSVPTEASG